MAIDIYSTHTLLESVRQLAPLTTFLQDRYFPTNPATDIFTTDDVLIEFQNGSKKAAPFVAPRKGGVTITRDGYYMKSFAPAYIAPQRTLTIDELKKRRFGEALYPTLTPAQRQAAIMLQDMDDMRVMIKRRKEAMAAEVIFTNGCIMHEYIDDLHNFEEKEIRFYDGEVSSGQFVPIKPWDTTEESGKQIINDLHSMIRMQTSRGLPATEALVAPDVADTLTNNEYILKLLDNRNYNIGGIDPTTLPSGATKLGRINVKGRMIDILSYEETYTDVDGTVKPFVPAGMVAVGAPAAGHTVHGAITQMEQSDREFHTYAGTEVPKYISDAANDVRKLRLASAPLPVPHNANPFSVAKVLGE
jgi:hypothetical protein